MEKENVLYGMDLIGAVKTVQRALGFYGEEDFRDHDCYLDAKVYNGIQGYKYELEVKVEPKTEEMNALLRLSTSNMAVLEKEFGESLRIRAYQGRYFPGLAFLVNTGTIPYQDGEKVNFGEKTE